MRLLGMMCVITEPQRMQLGLFLKVGISSFDGLRGKRLGIVRDPNLSPGSHGAISFEKHLATMRQKGATLVENRIFSNFLNISTVAEEIVLAYEFKRDLNIYLSELLQSPVHTLADIISFNTQHAMEISSVLAIAGYPGISVPAGYDTAGVPFGINFGGGRGSAPTLIEISYAFEQATKARKFRDSELRMTPHKE
ncbi:hypothetical protein KI387_037726 [Taxus chinensis]|uniref:Amidase n=1 Tax=Taxus chinensis TaxID=29808 RepID=A0AA38L6J7_TAXCH|nr:hypothetical protein KI387_037726 [Taxus chinensis]